MRTKKITAWVLFIAMLCSFLPGTVIAAEESTPAPYPNIITDTFGEMTNDITGINNGTDLDLSGETNNVLPEVTVTTGEETDTLDGVDGTVYFNKEKKIQYVRRKQVLSFVAESQEEDVTKRKFVDESTDTGISEGAVEIAYLNTDKQPLTIDLESETFEIIGTDNWDDAWIDLTKHVQRTNVNLKTFLEPENQASPVLDLRNGEPINSKKLTAADLFATGDKISFLVYNVIRGDFAGFLRVKITDNAGNTTVQDYPIVADGQYPAVEIKTSTLKNPVGEYIQNGGVLTNVATNTFIAEQDFVTVMEDIPGNEAENEQGTTKKSYRWGKLDEEALKSALNWKDENYKPEDIWAMDDITVESIVVSDEAISSGIKSVEYAVKNYTLAENVVPSSIVGDTALTYDETTGECQASSPIVIADEGFNVFAVTVTDNSGLKTTSRYYFYIDKEAPKAEFELVKTEKNVIQLLTTADVVTNRELALEMSASADVEKAVKIISGIAEENMKGENPAYQYRLLATKAGEAAQDSDNDGEIDVPEGYTLQAPAGATLTYGEWIVWAGSEKTDANKTPVITEEFDGIIQVRVQDRAGNWSEIINKASNDNVSEPDDKETTIITDNTNPVIEVKEYALDVNGDSVGDTAADIFAGDGKNILENSHTVTEEKNEEKNEVIETISGDKASWINDTAVLAVTIKDEDLANEIRSSGLDEGKINVKAEFHTENENKKVKILHNNKVDFKEVTDNFDLTSDYLFGTETDKNLTFYVEYEGTGVADITVSVKDQADVKDEDSYIVIYKVQLKVDKINPYIEYKGYDITDEAQKDLLKANSGAGVDYEVRNMPWGPNSQVLEVVVKDDETTPVQSRTKSIKFNTDKPLDLYKYDGTEFAKISSYSDGEGKVVTLTDCEVLANAAYEENHGYKFYLVYDGTGIAKVEFYAEDSTLEPNVRDYPSVATAADAEPVLYDAMLRVDKINPEIKNAQLVQTANDVNDGFMLYTVDETKVDVNTRKQMKVTFEITDENTTAEQAGVNIQNEKIAGVDLVDVYDKYVETDKTHLYDNEATAYVTDDTNNETIDPNIDYILLPVEVGEINGLGGKFTAPASASNADIEALVNTYIDKYAEATNPVVWQKASWKDGGIVVPDEFQGAIVLRTIDRVGNIDYSEPITFVAESRDALIDFEPQNGYIWSQNNYGWSKRDYDYVEIRVKDDNEDKVDAWLENVFISVTDLEGNDISTNDTVKYAYPYIHENDADLEVDPSGYTYVSLADFTNEAAYGYDVISKDGLVEKLARDEEGYIHLGYVRVAESAQIKVTIFDKAKHDDVEFTGNKTTGIWTSRIDRVAPVVTAFDVVPVTEGETAENNNNGFALVIKAEDALSGMAPAITDADYNQYTAENIPEAGVFGAETSYLYKITDDSDAELTKYDKGTFNAGQYEMPGLQYALIPGNGNLEEVAPWNFESDPTESYDENGYIGEMGKPYVWHNYVDDKTPMIPADFDGLIVARAIDKAGNITVVGYSAILDVEADDGWKNETQFIQVRADNKWKDGSVVNIEYYGNNNLLYPADMRKDLSNARDDGEGALIEIAEEGITNVVVTAIEKFTEEKTVKAKNDQRNSDWEGNMIIGNLTANGYEDWKFQLVDVKIDKTNPEFAFELIDESGNKIENEAVEGNVAIKLTDIIDPIPNMPDELGYRSHIPSDIAKVEWCAVPEGLEEENWNEATDWKNGEVGVLSTDAFTGTIKVRVTDNAGNVTEKSQRLDVDGVKGLINLSKSHDDIYSVEPVDVFVTVTENAEFSDITSVVYEVIDEEDNVVESDALTLIGGTVSVDREGTTKVKVTAETKAGVKESKEIIVKIDRTAPAFDMDVVDSEGSIKDRPTSNTELVVKAINIKDDVSHIAKVEYTAIPEGTVAEDWKTMTYDEDEKSAEFDFMVSNGAFTGTIKVRVTDNAGNVSEKSMRIQVDKALPIIVISKSYEENCSKGAVDVFVTVTEDEEFSAVKSVTYYTSTGCGETCDENCEHWTEGGKLGRTGGTITVKAVDKKDTVTRIKVVAENKAGEKKTEYTTVVIHPEDLEMPTLMGTKVNETEESDILSGAWVEKDSVTPKYERARETVKLFYSLNGSKWNPLSDEGTINELRPGENTIRIQLRDENCFCESDVNTIIVNYEPVDKAGATPELKIMPEEDAVTVRNSAQVVTLVPVKGDYASDIRSITYYLNHVKDFKGVYETKELTLSPNGGSIVIDKEGKWTISNVVITMESGEVINKPGENEPVVVANIDKTAPEFTDAKLVEKSEEELGLQALTEKVVSNKKLKLFAKATDNYSNVITYEYALMENGMTEPEWEPDGNAADGKLEVDNVITSDFEGSVLVKATDMAGNSVIRTLRVVADGAAPMVSITRPESTWINGDATITVNIDDEGSSGVESVEYILKKKGEEEKSGNLVQDNWANFTKKGGQLIIGEEGEYQFKVTVTDKAGNTSLCNVDIKIDKTAPTYSGSVALTLNNIHSIDNWNDIHDGWTYNHAVSMEGITDNLSGVKDVKVKVITETGNVAETVLGENQTGTSFETDGQYELTITDKAGNVRVIRFTIDKDLENVINVVGVDPFGKVHVAVTDGGERLSFFRQEDERFENGEVAGPEKMFEGVTNQLWEGKTGVRYIYGKNDSGKLTNKLHLIVAPSSDYELSLSNIGTTPNRYLDIKGEGENVSVIRNKAIFNAELNETVDVGTDLVLEKDGVYTITTD